MNESKGCNLLRQPHTLVRCGAMIACLLGAMPAARAELQIEITSGVRDPVPIAIVPFAHPEGASSDLDVADVVQHDLEGSGRFRALPRERMPAQRVAPIRSRAPHGRPSAPTTWWSAALRHSITAARRSTSSS